MKKLLLIHCFLSNFFWMSLPAQATSTADSYWRIPDTPSEGWKQVSFHAMYGKETDAVKRWYSANQFKAGGRINYIGLQPISATANPDKTITVQAIFSSFGKGAHIPANEKNCGSGADGGAGVSCSTRFTLSFGHVYELRVEQLAVTADSATWQGTVVDQTDRSQTPVHIGSWTLDSAAGIEASQASFLENIGAGGYRCGPADIRKIQVFIGNPTADSGRVLGVQGPPHEGSPCKGNQGYEAHPVTDASIYGVTGYMVQTGKFPVNFSGSCADVSALGSVTSSTKPSQMCKTGSLAQFVTSTSPTWLCIGTDVNGNLGGTPAHCSAQ